MSEIKEAVVVLCKCGKVHKTYGIRTEKLSGKRWNMTWAFPMKESTGKREGYDKVSVSGDIVMTDEYPGCPYCSQKNITVCSCGHISCTITRGGIFTCEWCGSQGRIGEYSGEKIVADMDL